MTEVRAVIESQFQQLQAMVERAQREVTEILEAEEKQALRQAEGIRVHLEQRCTELKKTQAQVEKISRNKNDVDFLQVLTRFLMVQVWDHLSLNIQTPQHSPGNTELF